MSKKQNILVSTASVVALASASMVVGASAA